MLQKDMYKEAQDSFLLQYEKKKCRSVPARYII